MSYRADQRLGQDSGQSLDSQETLVNRDRVSVGTETEVSGVNEKMALVILGLVGEEKVAALGIKLKVAALGVNQMAVALGINLAVDLVGVEVVVVLVRTKVVDLEVFNLYLPFLFC